MLNKASSTDDTQIVLDALSNFKCCKDIDIEKFLNEKAIQFLERGWCSVYLILNEQSFDNNILEVEAYFTLSHKSLITPDAVSGNKIKDVGGFKTASSLHFVLIGHLGKYISVAKKSAITIQEILEFIFEIVYASNELIPCRCVFVECIDKEEVKKIYESNGFTYFQFDGEHHQYYKRI